MPGGFGRHARGGELPQLVVDEREQLGGGLAVAGLGGLEKSGQIGHEVEFISSRRQKHTQRRAIAYSRRWADTDSSTYVSAASHKPESEFPRITAGLDVGSGELVKATVGN